MLADHHARYDFTSWDIFITILFASCVIMSVVVKRVMNGEDETA